MNDMSATIGHNNPPPSTIAAELAQEYSTELSAARECLDAAMTIPAKIEDEETQNKCGELTKKMREIELKLERGEKDKKAPVKAVSDAIGGFFKSVYEPLSKARERIKVVQTDYAARKKAAEEKRLREEEEARRELQRQAEQRAHDAEDTKNEAGQRLQESERLSREAKEAREAAVSEMDIAVADVAECKAESAKVRSESAAMAADFARLALEGNPVSTEDKELKRTEQKAKMEAARSSLETAEQRLRDARDAARRAKEEQQAREAQEAADAKKVREAAREVKTNLDEAVRHETVANKIEAKVDGPGADLARSRSIHGAVTTLQRRWKCELIDRHCVDIVKLAPFINSDALDAAGWKYMMAQDQANRMLSGFRMWEDEETIVR